MNIEMPSNNYMPCSTMANLLCRSAHCVLVESSHVGAPLHLKESARTKSSRGNQRAWRGNIPWWPFVGDVFWAHQEGIAQRVLTPIQSLNSESFKLEELMPIRQGGNLAEPLAKTIVLLAKHFSGYCYVDLGRWIPKDTRWRCCRR